MNANIENKVKNKEYVFISIVPKRLPNLQLSIKYKLKKSSKKYPIIKKIKKFKYGLNEYLSSKYPIIKKKFDINKI